MIYVNLVVSLAFIWSPPGALSRAGGHTALRTSPSGLDILRRLYDSEPPVDDDVAAIEPTVAVVTSSATDESGSRRRSHLT